MSIIRNLLLCSILALSLIILQGCAGGGHRGPYYLSGPRAVTTCFYNFDGIYQDRIYPVLSEAPGVSSIERCWSSCNQKRPCICYHLTYDGPIDELIACLNRRLPVNKTVPFRCVAKGPNKLEITFDAGFK